MFEEKQEIKMDYLSCHDMLTGLYTKKFLKEKIKDLNLSQKAPISFMLFQLKGLNFIKKRYDNSKIDKIILKTADMLKAIERNQDILCRVDTGKFLMMLPQTNKIEVKNILDHLDKKNQEIMKGDLPLALEVAVEIKKDKQDKNYAVSF